MEITINLEIKVSINESERTGVENVTNCVREMELNKAVTKQLIEEYQNKLIEELIIQSMRGTEIHLT